MTFEEEEHYIISEIKIAIFTIIMLMVWVCSIYLTNFNLLLFPNTLFTGVLLVLAGIWFGFALKRRKATTGSIRKVKE